MPSFEFTCDVEFEVYCSCGEGICHLSKGGNTPGRGEPFVEVEPCDTCMTKARDEANVETWDEANKKIAELENTINRLENEVTTLQQEIENHA